MFNSLKQETKDASHEERQTTTFDDENPVKVGKENQACNCGPRFRLRSMLACVAARLSRWKKVALRNNEQIRVLGLTWSHDFM